MSNKSRRRIKLAAGAILAGAAIPIAAAGTAWADDDQQPQQVRSPQRAPVRPRAQRPTQRPTRRRARRNFIAKVLHTPRPKP